jgi:cell division FtsZ-interacting protein ZapD
MGLVLHLLAPRRYYNSRVMAGYYKTFTRGLCNPLVQLFGNQQKIPDLSGHKSDRNIRFVALFYMNSTFITR